MDLTLFTIIRCQSKREAIICNQQPQADVLQYLMRSELSFSLWLNEFFFIHLRIACKKKRGTIKIYVELTKISKQAWGNCLQSTPTGGGTAIFKDSYKSDSFTVISLRVPLTKCNQRVKGNSHFIFISCNIKQSHLSTYFKYFLIIASATVNTFESLYLWIQLNFVFLQSLQILSSSKAPYLWITLINCFANNWERWNLRNLLEFK